MVRHIPAAYPIFALFVFPFCMHDEFTSFIFKSSRDVDITTDVYMR